METYAVQRLVQIFDQHKPRMDAKTKTCLSETIVNALIEKNTTYAAFKVAFWKILWNLHLKGPERSKKTLDDLFDGRWCSVQEFINAKDDELDRECESFRQSIRLKEFNKMENTKRINAFLDKDIESDSGLFCSRCKSNNTDYSLMQTKSGDESSTVFALCKNCGKRWKFVA